MIIDMVTRLLNEAIVQHASDIHIEPYTELWRIRYRLDGLLREVCQLSKPVGTQLITRLKVMADLNTAEQRLPQDGRIVFSTAAECIYFRVSTCPTIHGEKAVLRLLNQQLPLRLCDLGLLQPQLDCVMNAIQRKDGLILIAGPTGSGKTITLYSILQQLNCGKKNIISIEDPVEIEMHGINQTSINPLIGLSFASALRSFLRQDPDIIFIGEIRDHETAEIALQAAQTGHLVFSTLHAYSTAQAITRFQDLTNHSSLMQLISSLTLVITQQLIRLLCKQCNAEKDSQCAYCWEGYARRTAIFECRIITPHRIGSTQTLSVDDVSHLAADLTLEQSGLEKIKQGLTTSAEIQHFTATTNPCAQL